MADDNEKLIGDAACAIHRAFEDYNAEFHAITQRSRRRFEEREWKLGQRDAVERIELYDRRVVRCVAGLVGLMGSSIADEATWGQVRQEFATLIGHCVDAEFYKTFFNSLTRKAFNTVGVNTSVEFLAPDLEPTLNGSAPSLLELPAEGPLHAVVDNILEQFPSHSMLTDRPAAARQVAGRVDEFIQRQHPEDPLHTIEMLGPVFYRATRAFCVGRLQGEYWTAPLVLAFKNMDNGIVVDAVMIDDSDVRSLFGFSRSYFHADLPAVGATVNFLQTIMPTKPVGELYTILGRAKQGKTERYRRLYKHLTEATDKFVHAEGQKGMVMIVFTMASYELVFKVIRDHFEFPKTASRADVMERYQFVFRHDRAGRLVDAQEFRRLRFPVSLFADELLEELRTEADQSCHIDGDDLIIDHCYIERRLRPLNLYLQEVDTIAAHRAVIDYGRTIRELARSNVFPGDLLLKNFGVTSTGRIIFYDYDELCLVTDCVFRDLPQPRFDEDEMRAEPWFYVGPNDVFPEQFVNFLGMPADLRDVFIAHHADLLTAEFWRDLKSRHVAEQWVEVVPYGDATSSTADGATV